MSAWRFDMPTACWLLGFVFLVAGTTLWFLLRHTHPRENLLAWCAGTLSFGVGSLLFAVRDSLAPSALALAAAIVLVSYPLQVGALQLEMNRKPRWNRKAVLSGLTITGLFAISSVSSFGRQAAYFALMLCGVVWLTWTTLHVWRVTRLPSARLIGLGCSAMVAAGALGLPYALFSPVGRMENDQLSSMIVMSSGLLAALMGSLGYVGMATERANRREMLKARELERESSQRQTAEQYASKLQGWLNEREELLQLLAHEVRQPLNNAMAALHATHTALAARNLDAETVSQRLRRAEAVLSQITGTVDNTLAATALLASPDRVQPRDADVDTLSALSIGDLSPALRQRVQINRVSHVRTVTMDAALMRLALRNLLINAGKHAPPNTPIVLRVTDSEVPLGLVFAVIDEGPGIAPELAHCLFERGVRGQNDPGGHGLGLYVVRRVMELHGGTATVAANPGGGAIFSLTLPQTDEAWIAPSTFSKAGLASPAVLSR